MSESVAAQLERNRLELLDLSTRNRLLSTPRHSKHAKTVDVVDEISSEVFRLMVRESKAFTFLAGKEDPSEDQELAEDADPDFAPLPQPEDDEEDERGIAKRHSDTRLQTILTSKALQKRLLSLYYDSRTYFEEQGVNILYLALGMLKWFEDDKSETERWAPLVLVPVGLERQSAGQRFKLRALPEDPSANISLEAKLRSEFGLKMPDFPESDDLDIAAYLAQVKDAVAGRARWEVHADDMVLGFFSFSKFLMYRDLDAGNWPEGKRLDLNATLVGLLRDGFEPEEGLIGEDDKIDPHVPPSAQIHVMDADSSQTLAIEEVRRGRNLVIQGPPGTGKSQTIANLIAGAVAGGRKVLFVAEKMAALDVVKRRLDAIGLGAICLELHSNKANKRAVLDELRRTKELGRPLTDGAEAGVIDRLTSLRDWLNTHAELMHLRHRPSTLTLYAMVGHLVRLRGENVPPPDFQLTAPESWTPEDKRLRERLLTELAERVAEIGRPADHPWRGVMAPAILPMDLERLMPRLNDLSRRLETAAAARDRLVALLGIDLADTIEAAGQAIAIADAIVQAPDMDRQAVAASCWGERIDDVAELVEQGAIHAQARLNLDGTLAEIAWSAEVGLARQHMAAFGSSWLRFLNGDYRRAVATLRSLLAREMPKALPERIALLDTLMAGQKAARTLERDAELGRSVFGSHWRNEKSDWDRARRKVEWIKEVGGRGLPEDFRAIVARVSDIGQLAMAASELRQALTGLSDEVAGVFSALSLDVPAAFGVPTARDLAMAVLVARLGLWRHHGEDLSRWITYRLRADEARAAGMGPLVERLHDGRMAGEVLPAFERAYYEAVFRAMVAAHPEIARFDGDAHGKLVEDFRQTDKARIELARLEVLQAHHRNLPQGNAGIGPLGVLNGEFAKKKNHMAIRKLMEKAAPAIQAIKPVFMMSPLSVAQYVPPGLVDFDLLLIDEASQVMPVDALGAMARARQVVVVGDTRQLPPTNFFARAAGDSRADDDDEEEGSANATIKAADAESILELCLAKGMPPRMLRWHYRSKHQSLIVVSNREFYDNKLYIVPSPYTAEAGMGLAFRHLPQAVYDAGNTRTNAVEAKAVAEAIIRHAKATPHLSLGVGTFSTAQRQAILDDLEHLRRLHPDTEDFFNAGGAEPFFVKNLENIQGDERDVIFISVGYGRTKTGYIPMGFGPVSREGGERRLNVLISRAKRRCEVFSGITDEDIDLARAKSRGAAALKAFLQFCRTGKLHMPVITDREMDSVFEEQVAKAIAAHGWQVVPQVGLAGFFIDLGIADSERPGRFILGIECDGATYHSSRSARDRDRLRQAVLEDHGWIIHRIWSTDWFNRPDAELRKVLAAIEVARAELDERGEREMERERAVPIELVTWERDESPAPGLSEEAVTAIPYREAVFPVPDRQELHEVPISTLANLAEQVVAVEGPVHGDEIANRLRSLWGLQKTGSRIKAAVDSGLKRAVTNGRLIVDVGFYTIPGAEVVVRDRADVQAPGLRKPDMLPPAEIRLAVVDIVQTNFGATRDEAAIGVARLFGFKATSAQLKAVIEREVDALVTQGALQEREGILAAVPQR